MPVCVHVTEIQFRRGVAEVNVYDYDRSPVRSTDNCSVPQIEKLLTVSRVYTMHTVAFSQCNQSLWCNQRISTVSDVLSLVRFFVVLSSDYI